MLQERITNNKTNHVTAKTAVNAEEEHLSLHDDSCNTKTNQIYAILFSKVRNHEEFS